MYDRKVTVGAGASRSQYHQRGHKFFDGNGKHLTEELLRNQKDGDIFNVRGKSYSLVRTDRIALEARIIVSARLDCYSGTGVMITFGKHMTGFRDRMRDSTRKLRGFERLEGIADFVRQNIADGSGSQDKIEGSNTLATLDKVIKSGKGECLQRSAVLGSILNSENELVDRYGKFYLATGTTVEFIIEAFFYGHAWIEMRHNGSVYVLDDGGSPGIKVIEKSNNIFERKPGVFLRRIDPKAITSAFCISGGNLQAP